MRSWFFTDEQYETWVTGSFWLFVLIILFLAAWLNPITGNNQYQNCHTDAKNIYDIRIESLVGSANSHKEQKDQKTKTDHDQEYLKNKATCSDLKAQWSMSIVTYIAFCVGTIGILLVYRTLSATRETIRVTREAADRQVSEAKVATQVTRDMGVAQARAYLGVFNVTTAEYKGQRPDAFPVWTRINLLNTGNTPAKNVTIRFGHIIDRDDDAEVTYSVTSEFGSIMNGKDISLEFDCHSGTNWIQHLTEIMNEQARIIVAGQITYEDVFKGRQTTNFRYYLTGRKIDDVKFYRSNTGNEMT